METQTVEYLTELLRERDQEISKLGARLEDLERILAGDVWGWTVHGKLTNEENMDLPVPRLELRWEQLDDGWGYNWAALYRLVYRHFLDDICFIPFGYTRRGGDREPMSDYPEDLPFREGTHIKSDARQLGLPAFVINGNKVHQIDLEGYE